MAASSSNESFGLKIATSLSIALTVALLIAVYFLNSYYTQEVEKSANLEKKLKTANEDVRTVTTQANEFRTLIGYPLIEDFEAAKAQMKKDNEAIKTELQAMQNDIATIVTEFQKKIEAKGADASQFEALKQRAKELVDGYVTNSNPSYMASLARLKDLTVNQAKLSTNVALSFIDLRRELELANKVNADMKKVIEDAYATAKAELDATIKKDEEARSGLVTDTQNKAEQIAALETKLTNATNDLQAKIDKQAKKLADKETILSDLKDEKARNENVMSKPGGRVTYVDYSTKTVRVSVNRSQGVRPLMRFTIFDKNSVGITSDRPKAAVELIKVGDPAKGETDSLARIINTFEPTDPIRYNDLIFSVGWSYDHPQRFALIGKIDVNRDGRDDRAELIRSVMC
jgi:sarcosine oxidase gamma subunit